MAESSIVDIQLEESRFDDVREGYQSLRWQAVEGAGWYQVLDSSGLSYYDGKINEAFISGLPDGEHEFEVQAFSQSGEQIGASSKAAVIVVNHWPLSQALVLFGIGLVVVFALIGAIVFGVVTADKSFSVEHGSGQESES